MNKLLFVDDDYIIIRSYLNQVDWKRLGINEVYSATNGEDAKKLIRIHKPNILVSDVEMPGMSGLELTKWIRAQEYDIKVIFLSAFDDFRYAQTAVHLNCVEYLLKPVTVQALSAAVESAIDTYDNEQCRAEYAVLAQYWLQNCDVVYEKYWQAVLNGEYKTSDIIFAEAEKNGINLLDSGRFSLFLFKVQQRTGGVSKSPQPLVEDLQRVSRSYFAGCAQKSYTFHLIGEIYVAVLLTPQKDVEYTCKEFSELCRAELSVPVLVVGGSCKQVDVFSSLCGQLQTQLSTLSNAKTNTQTDISLSERIRIYVAENLSEDISKYTVAEYVSLNPDYVSKLFKKETGLSIPDYITEQKLYRARRMLLQTDHSIGTIATELGYTNFSYFTKLFCRKFGCTPKEYRRNFAEIK